MDVLPDDVLLIIFGENLARLPVCRRFWDVFTRYAAALEDIYTTRRKCNKFDKIRPGGLRIGSSRAGGGVAVSYAASYGYPAHSGDRIWYDSIYIQDYLIIIYVKRSNRSSDYRVYIKRTYPVSTFASIRTRSFTGVDNAIARAKYIVISRGRHTLRATSYKELVDKHASMTDTINYSLCLSHTGAYLQVHAAARLHTREQRYEISGIRQCACYDGYHGWFEGEKCNNAAPYPRLPITRGDLDRM